MKKFSIVLLFVANYTYAQISTFKPQVYKPVQEDYSILQRSLEKLEHRKNEANEQYSRLQMLLAEYGSKLYYDEATLAWFDEYNRTIKADFYSLSALGWGEARDFAIRKQGEIANDPELIARIRTSIEYIEKTKAIEGNTEMNREQKNEWRINHPYCFVPIKNGEGRVIGGRLGSKAELEEQKREKEKQQREAEERARKLEQMEKDRIYKMEHPFDDFNYSSYETVVTYPFCKKCPEGMTVTKVALSSSETRVEMEYRASFSNQWVNFARDTYIELSGCNILYLVRADNIAYYPSKSVFKNSGEILKFALIFPPLPINTKYFSVMEPDKNGYKFKKIKLK